MVFEAGYGWQATLARLKLGGLAQLGERLVCNQEVTGSSPVFSTSLRSRPEQPTASYGWQASLAKAVRHSLGDGGPG